MRIIQQGDRVRVHYTTKSLEGSVIETSQRREPLEFTAGGDGVIAGLSEGVIGMAAGESRELTVPAEQAFGRHYPDLIQTAPVSLLPEDLQAGDQLTATVDGIALDVWAQRIGEDEAVIDANHPLSGETLVIDVEVVGFETVSR
ncbi:MAG: FKBP-type peptidyl-prolyl cis-trans isomerase [Planctomycetaceae bacterium]|nr:FKBP-type peptidyl-prolyl cis-trans isomerase [Planctomycetaceae bacterium]